VEARSLARLLIAGWLVVRVDAAAAESLDSLIPNLFGGSLSTSITPFVDVETQKPDVQRPRVAERFRGLSAALATAASQAPVPSASGAFQFEWDSELDTFVRRRQSLGSLLAERGQTLGHRTITASVSYTRIEFSTLDGDSLSRVRSVQPALTEDFLSQLPEADRARAEDDVMETTLDLDFDLDLIFFTAAYGLTDRIDLSLALSVNRARMRGRAEAIILDPQGDQGAFFVGSQPGVIVGDPGSTVCSTHFRCARDAFDESSGFKTGDLYLRGKWHFAGTPYADLAAAAVLTLPTGNADDFLGFHDVTFTPWLIASKDFGRVSPHVNLGYSMRSGNDVSQARWIAGADVRATRWLTVASDFLGFHDDKRDGINDNVVQSAVELKLNPFGQTVIGVGFQFPVNREGIRADVIYTLQVENTF
jgi:hypothetical protein